MCERSRPLKAFTLIELLVVLAILSIVLFIIAPSVLTSLEPQRTKNFVMRLQNTLLYLSDRAILEKKVYLFHFDLDERRYSFQVSEKENPTGEVKDRYLIPQDFPQKLSVVSVKVIPGKEFTEGKATIPFTPNGMLYSFEITIEEKKDRYYVVRGISLNNEIESYTRTADEL